MDNRVIIICAIMIPILVSGCTTNNNGGDNETLFVKIGDIIPQDVCAARGIDNSVLILHQTGCPACIKVLPLLEELESELGMEFEYYNLAIDEDLGAIKAKYDLLPTHTPTVIIDCAAYGAKTKEEYKSLLNGQVV